MSDRLHCKYPRLKHSDGIVPGASIIQTEPYHYGYLVKSSGRGLYSWESVVAAGI